MNCVEEQDARVTVATTSSQHRRYGASPITTPQFEVRTGFILETVLPQRPSSPRNEIVLGTTRPAPTRSRTSRWWSKAVGAVRMGIRGMLEGPVLQDSPVQRQHYPKRYQFLEHSCLAREMRRL